MSLPAHLFRTVSRRSVLSAGSRSFSYTPSLLVRPQNPPKKPTADAGPAAPAPSASPLDPSTAPTPPPLEPFVTPGKAAAPPTSTFSESSSTTTAPTTPPSSSTASAAGAADSKAAPGSFPAAAAVEEEVIPDRPDLSMLPSLDVDPSALPEPAEEGADAAGKPTGAKSSKQQGGFNMFDKLFLGSLGAALVGGGWYLGRPLTDEERVKLNLKVRLPALAHRT